MAAVIQNRWPRPEKSDGLAGDLSSTVQELSRQGEPDLIVRLPSRRAATVAPDEQS